MARTIRLAAVAVLLVSATQCGDSQAPITPAPLRATALRIEGVSNLKSAGDQTRLTARARFNDGSERDVTQDASWNSSDAAVATIAPGGLVTATGLGVTDIQATYLLVRATLSLTVSPVPTYSASGWVRSPGSSAVPGVLVSEPVSRRWTLTSNSGEYHLIGLVGPRLLFEKDGYESAEITAIPNRTDNDAKLQQVVRVNAGGQVDDQLAPHDVDYTIGEEQCGPCRRIRIGAPAAGRLRLELTWTIAHAGFRLFANGRVYSPPGAELAVTADYEVTGGEVIVYVGASAPSSREYFPYRLATSFAPR